MLQTKFLNSVYLCASQRLIVHLRPFYFNSVFWTWAPHVPCTAAWQCPWLHLHLGPCAAGPGLAGKDYEHVYDLFRLLHLNRSFRILQYAVRLLWRRLLPVYWGLRCLSRWAVGSSFCRPSRSIWMVVGGRPIFSLYLTLLPASFWSSLPADPVLLRGLCLALPLIFERHFVDDHRVKPFDQGGRLRLRRLVVFDNSQNLKSLILEISAQHR